MVLVKRYSIEKQHHTYILQVVSLVLHFSSQKCVHIEGELSVQHVYFEHTKAFFPSESEISGRRTLQKVS